MTDPADDLALDLELARRRRARKAAGRRRMALFGALVAVVCVAAGVGLAVASRGRKNAGEAAAARPPVLGGPSPSAEGGNWTAADLRDYLRSCGLACRLQPHGNASALYFGPGDDDRSAAFHVNRGDLESADAVLVHKEPTEAAARDEAGRRPASAFSWGRFWFEGGTNRLSAVSAALTGKPFAPSR